MKNNYSRGIFFIASLLVATSSFAQKAGDTVLGVGWAFIHPNSSLTPTSTTGGGPMSSGAPFYGAAESTIFNNALRGAGANIEKASTPTVSILHMITNDIGAELSFGVPPKLTVNISAPNNNLGPTSISPAATAKALTPALVAKYFFMSPDSAFRPYIGLGVTHASFNNITLNSSSSTVMALASTSASLSSSWAPVYNFGLIYNINDKWSINGSVSYIPLATDVKFVGPGLSPLLPPVTTTTRLTVNPTDYIIRIGYKF